MSLHAAAILQISRGAKKDPCEVHQLTEWKIGNQNRDQKEMDVEDEADSLRPNGLKAEELNHQSFHLDQIDSIKQPHEYSGRDHSQEKKESEVIRRKRDVPQLRLSEPSKEEIAERRKDEDIGDINDGKEVLKDTIEGLDEEDQRRHRLREEAQMSE